MRFGRAAALCFLYPFYNNLSKIILVALSSSCSMYTKSACVIIHGTWAQGEAWCRSGGDFFEAVKTCNNEIKKVDEVVSFFWSGKLGYPAQVEAAQDLAKTLNLYDDVVLIAHSHGATVGMIASQIIYLGSTDRNNKGKIAQFYALGVPVRESITMPNMYVIKKFYNIFSFADFVQTVNGNYDRAFKACDGVVNISVMLNNIHPGHAQLHHPVLGAWLLKIEDFLAKRQIGNFEQFDFYKPALISFSSQKHPCYLEQNDQGPLLECDKKMYELAKNAFFRRPRSA